MRLPDFELERYFAAHELNATHLLCASDVEPLRLDELLALADDEERERFAGLSLGYTEVAGDPRLRAEIAGLYETLEPDDVYVFSGATEGIFVALSALLGPGDHAISLWPAYQALYEVARGTGADVDLLELHADEGWRLDLDRLAALLRPTTRVVIVNFPHNPTGALPDAATWRALVELCEDAGCLLLGDEVYRHLEYDAADRLANAADLSPCAISLGVLSKSFGLAGLRIGWLATRDRDVLRAVARLRDYTALCNSGPSEALAVIALRAREALLERTRAIVAPNLERVRALMAAHPDRVDWVEPRAGTVGLPRLRSAEPVADVAARLAREDGVVILPDDVYGMRQNRFRLGFGRRDLPVALERFERHLAAA